jgi:acetylcholinesterase
LPSPKPQPKLPKTPQRPQSPPLTHLIFGTFPRTPSATPPGTAALSEFVQGAWARFAKDPWSGPGWTGVGRSPTGFDVGSFGGKGRGAGVVVVRAKEADGRCAVFEEWYRRHAGGS